MKNWVLIIFILMSLMKLKAQSLNAYILQFHGVGCNNQSGKLAVDAVGGTGSYTYLWSNGSTLDTAYNLGAGVHWVTVYSGNDSIVKFITLDPWGIDSVMVLHACNGLYGSIYLDNINAQYPITYHWYDNNGLLAQSTASLGNITAGNYYYSIVDAEGCSDSGAVEIVASNPILFAYVSDSTLCYGQSAQVWYSPGFTLYDNWGVTYNSNTDTIIAQNYMNLISYPTYGIDSFGCEASLNNSPFAYLQSHPDPVPLYQFGDTISANFGINLNPSSTLIYTWSIAGNQIVSGPYSYLPIDSSGFYSVIILNQFGCSNFGSIQAYITGLEETKNYSRVSIHGNPCELDEQWHVFIDNFTLPMSYSIYDASGKVILNSQTSSSSFSIQTPNIAGMYYLKIGGENYKLIKK
jgi:hypothetical protein